MNLHRKQELKTEKKEVPNLLGGKQQQQHNHSYIDFQVIKGHQMSFFYL